MPGVPDQPVLREVEDLMQREAQLNHAQITGEVSGAIRTD